MAQPQPKQPEINTSLDSPIIVNDFRDEIVLQVRQEHKYHFELKRGRYKDWNANEDEYYQRVPSNLDSRFQVPFPFMSGFGDTWKSKINEKFMAKFEDTRQAGYRAALKVQAFYDDEARNEDTDWEQLDIDGDHYAFLNGRCINKGYPEVIKRKFKFCVENVDPYDFGDEMTPGGNLEAHGSMSQDGMLRTKYQLLELADAGYYDKAQVLKLITQEVNKTGAIADEWFTAKQNRLISLGLDNKTWTQAGQSKYKIIESGTTFRGRRWLVTWNRETGIWIRCVPLIKVHESNLWPWMSWSPKREAHNSWPLSPADDFRPVAVAMKVFLNQELDNRNKKNWDMRAFDPDMFPDTAELDWRPGGLVAVKSGATRTRRIDAGIYHFQTPNLEGTINMIDYLDNLSGTKLGITNATQGTAKEDKVGIFLGNQQAIADRVDAVCKQRRKMQIARARRFVWAAYQYLPEPQAVQILGDKGLGWDKLRKNEINPELKIHIDGGVAQAQAAEMKSKKKAEALTAIGADPELKAQVNPKWRAEQILRVGEVPDEELTEAMDTQDYGQKELMARAAEAIEALEAGQKPPIVYDATTAFVKKIMDKAFSDKDDIKPYIFDRLVAYANFHIPIAAKNAARTMAMRAAQTGTPMDNTPPDYVLQANQSATQVPAKQGVIQNA